jgi:cysteine desulfurase
MESSREKVASIIGANTDEIIFTSGGTESDNIAIKGIAYRFKRRGNHIITSNIEHPAVDETCKYLEKNGFEVTYLPVEKDGIVNSSDLEDAITDKTILITVMHANNEIGTIQPISELGEIARENKIYFHTDAVQSVGKIPVNVEELNVDMLSLSAHKLYGPKGVRLEPIIHGGGHEKGIRPGTENVAGIVGLGKACEIAEKTLEEEAQYLTTMRDELIRRVLSEIDESYLNGHPTKRLPNNINFRFTGIEGESLVLHLDSKNIASSTGSACSSKKLEASHVLMALGLEEVQAHGSLRLTLGKENKVEDTDYVIESIKNAVDTLRKMSPLWCQAKV